MNIPSVPFPVLGIGTLLVVAVVLLAFLTVRQMVASRSRGAFECALRRRGLVGGTSWQHGLMRFGRDRLRWFRAFSVRPTAEVVIRRADIAEVSRERIPARMDGEPDSVLVAFRLRDGREISAIVDLVSGAALNSWIEAAPMGSVRGDAD